MHFFVARPPNAEHFCAEYTLYASPTGDDQNTGTSPSSPKTLLGAAAAAQPGTIVCLLAGTYSLSDSFVPPTSGEASAWIVYKSCGDGPVNFVWTGAADAQPMIKIGGGKFPSKPSYLEFRGLNLDGRGKALDGFFCSGAHHLRFIDNTIVNTGGGGIVTVTCDYLTADHNVVHHNGYIPADAGKNAEYYSWTSGISFNSNQWFNRYDGFHNIIANNIVSGEVDQSPKHTDGNGIILDLSNRTYDYGSANTPPALVLNNLVYGNGGRCVMAYTVTNFWIMNNTCYKNGLDISVNAVGSITTNNARDGYILNNIVVSNRGANPSYDQQNNNTNIHYYSNLNYGSHNELKEEPPSSVFIEADPMLLNPPQFDAEAERQYENTLAPSQLGNGLLLQPTSPVLGKGVDPVTLPKLPEAILSDLKKYIYADIKGNPRPRGGPFDLGAYQASSTSAK
jgi:serralysin